MTTRPSRRAADWSTTRRVSDWLFRHTIPGRHHTLNNSLYALMTARELAP